MSLLNLPVRDEIGSINHMTGQDMEPQGERITDADLDMIGRAAHEAWKGWIVQAGYADHAWISCYIVGLSALELARLPSGACAHPLGPSGCHSHFCLIPEGKHHPDMVLWEELPESKRGKYIATGRAGYDLGYAAGVAYELERDSVTAKRTLHPDRPARCGDTCGWPHCDCGGR